MQMIHSQTSNGQRLQSLLSRPPVEKATRRHEDRMKSICIIPWTFFFQPFALLAVFAGENTRMVEPDSGSNQKQPPNPLQ